MGAAGRSCPQHRCFGCQRGPSDAGGMILRYVDCPRALCYDCIEHGKMQAMLQPTRSCLAFENVGFLPPSCYEYMRCPSCVATRWSGAPPGVAGASDDSYEGVAVAVGVKC